jgi:hypothetical protein
MEKPHVLRVSACSIKPDPLSAPVIAFGTITIR